MKLLPVLLICCFSCVFQINLVFPVLSYTFGNDCSQTQPGNFFIKTSYSTTTKIDFESQILLKVNASECIQVNCLQFLANCQTCLRKVSLLKLFVSFILGDSTKIDQTRHRQCHKFYFTRAACALLIFYEQVNRYRCCSPIFSILRYPVTYRIFLSCRKQYR